MGLNPEDVMPHQFWASVRLVKPEENAMCWRCGRLALLLCRAEFPLRGVGRHVGRSATVSPATENSYAFACLDHAGRVVFAAAYALAVGWDGPT